MVLYIYQLSKFFVNPWFWALGSIPSLKNLRGHSRVHFTPTVNFSKILRTCATLRAMTDFWSQKTSYANAGHRQVTSKLRVLFGSSLSGSLNFVVMIVTLSAPLRMFSFFWLFFKWLDVSNLENTKFTYIFWHWAQERGFLMLPILCSWQRWSLTLTEKYSFGRPTPASSTLFWIWQCRSYFFISMQPHEYSGSEQITGR